MEIGNVIMAERISIKKYPGVYYRCARKIGTSPEDNKKERVFYIRYKIGKKCFEECIGRESKDNMTAAQAAKIRIAKLSGKISSRMDERNKQKEENRWTIDKLWEEYKSLLTNPKTLYTDEGRYNNYIKPVFKDKVPSQIEHKDIDALKTSLNSKKRKPQTIKHVLTLLQRIVNFGVKRDYCQKFSLNIEKPKVNNIKTEDLTSEQMTRLLDSIEKDDNEQVKNMMKLVLFTGMRRGEMFKLKWDDVDFNRGFIYIRDPKGGSDQKIPLNDEARNLLESHSRIENTPYVFPGRNGKQRTTCSKQVDRIKKRAGLPKDFRPLHGLRHTYASMLASSGKVDLYTIQKLLTYKSPVMTQRYAHLRDEALKKASDLAGSIIKEIASKKKEEEE